MTKARSICHRASQTAGHRRRCPWRLGGVFAVGLLLLTGCTSGSWNLFQPTTWGSTKTTPGKTSTSWLTSWVTLTNEEAQLQLDKAKALFGQKEYAQATPLFHELINPKKVSATVAEEALFYEGECYRERNMYPDASDIYCQLLKEYPRGVKHKETLQHMFDIADEWLKETSDVMKAQNEQRDGKRSFVMPVSLLHFGDPKKPMFDMQGRAMSLLEKIYLNGLDGPLGEISLFYLGNISLYEENYEDADHYYAQLREFYPKGQYASQAMELGIMCKQMIARGVEYDGRSTAEARDLIQRAKTAYPELARDKGDFFQRQIFAINIQQAEKDLSVAEFYRRTNHPGSAYFYYELVRRRYPGTKQAELATQRMSEVKDQAEREQNGGGWSWLNPFGKKAETPPAQPAKTTNPVMGPPQPVKTAGPALGPPAGSYNVPQQGYSAPPPGYNAPPSGSYPQPAPGTPAMPYYQGAEQAPPPRPAAPGYGPYPPYTGPYTPTPTQPYSGPYSPPYTGPYTPPAPNSGGNPNGTGWQQ